MSSTSIPKVVPAQLSFLSIYNPSLGKSDDTIHEQIVFFYPKPGSTRSKHDVRNPAAERELREQENEKLRQVGLAQGMVSFARSFSNGEALNSVETHKSRIVMHELEPGWWILASIDLTQLPIVSSYLKSSNKTSDDSAPAIEYSSREVSPPALLIQQLISANSVFLLHHAASLQELFQRVDRTKFCNLLDRFWTRFATSWDIMLHGSPAVDIFGGIKLAAGGELGMGVGEEEWGSGEREVLEDYARRTDGLMDIIVSRFGEPSPLQYNPHKPTPTNARIPAEIPPDHEQWLGSGRSPSAADGVVFAGLGTISRKSLKDVSHWIESIYSYGEHAYGVRENPSSGRRKRRRRNQRATGSDRSTSTGKQKQNTQQLSPEKPAPKSSHEAIVWAPGIPRPIVTAVESSLDNATAASENHKATNSDSIMASLNDSEVWMKYLTLGYGTAWGGIRVPSSDQSSQSQKEADAQSNDAQTRPRAASMKYIDPAPDVDEAEERRKIQVRQETSGYFIIGLKGDMESGEEDDENDEGDWNNRIPLRTIYVELASDGSNESTGEESIHPSFDTDGSNMSKLTRLRPIVYINRPFIYTFLFRHRTESLALASFYRNIHTYFAPLHRPLSNSTSPGRVAARIAAASNPCTTISAAAGAGPNTQPIYDLVYDPRTFTVHSSIPNIPDPGTLSDAVDWSRVEALNVHSQILATVSGTSRSASEIERTCKTSRGWWVVWMRLPPSQDPRAGESAEEAERDLLRQAFLIRRARDGAGARSKTSGAGTSSSRAGSGMWRLGRPTTTEKMGGVAAGWGPRGLAEGIGIDARKYVEGLLSLNR